LLLLHSLSKALGIQPSLPHTYLPALHHLGLLLLLLVLLLLLGLWCLVGVVL
jgi:hypothetical protein